MTPTPSTETQRLAEVVRRAALRLSKFKYCDVTSAVLALDCLQAELDIEAARSAGGTGDAAGEFRDLVPCNCLPHVCMEGNAPKGTFCKSAKAHALAYPPPAAPAPAETTAVELNEILTKTAAAMGHRAGGGLAYWETAERLLRVANLARNVRAKIQQLAGATGSIAYYHRDLFEALRFLDGHAPETPGPQPVSAEKDEDDKLRFDPQHVIRRLNRWQDDETVSPINVRIVLQNAEECIRRLVSRDVTAPAPTPPDAAQAPKGMEDVERGAECPKAPTPLEAVDLSPETKLAIAALGKKADHLRAAAIDSELRRAIDYFHARCVTMANPSTHPHQGKHWAALRAFLESHLGDLDLPPEGKPVDAIQDEIEALTLPPPDAAQGKAPMKTEADYLAQFDRSPYRNRHYPEDVPRTTTGESGLSGGDTFLTIWDVPTNAPNAQGSTVRVWLPDGTYIAGRREGLSPVLETLDEAQASLESAHGVAMEAACKTADKDDIMARVARGSALVQEAIETLTRLHSTATQADGGTK